MTTADLYLKVKLLKGTAEATVVVTDRTGAPIMRCFDATPLKAIRKMKAFVEARLKEQAA